MSRPLETRSEERERAAILVPWTHGRDRPSDDRLQETQGLVEALDSEVSFIRAEHVRKPTASHLLSGGLLDRLAEDAADASCSLIVIDSALTPMQQRNLELRLGVKVIDRTGLILEIFGLRALTREGRLQVELARLQYERSRLVRTWTHLERQRGGRGFLGGPGETQLEADKRMIDQQVRRLRRDLTEVKRTRDVQRSGRRRGDKPVIALVGYTNAGKSTLFNQMSGADVLAKDMPFATLDPTIRRLDLPNLGEAALVDTVGFITDLPTHLVESFQATLEETLDADLLIHVRDRSSDSDESQKQDVLKVLEQLSASTKRDIPPILEAWNKIDLLSEGDRLALEQAARTSPDDLPLPVSAVSGEGVEALLDTIELSLSAERRQFHVDLLPAMGAARAWLHRHAIVDREETLSDGTTQMIVWLSEKDFGQMRGQYPDVDLRVARN